MSTAETWLPVVDFDGFYEISDAGRVRSVGRLIYVAASARSSGYFRRQAPRILKTSSAFGGYGAVTLWRGHVGEQARVHVLVLEAFVGPRPEGRYGCHVDGDAGNNRLPNLYWGTPTENAADKHRHGTHIQGAAIPWARLTEPDVRRIRSLRGVASQREIAAEYGIGQPQVSRIQTRREWRHVAP